MGYPSKHLTPDEEIITQFRPHWRLLAIPLFWFLLAVAGVVAVWSLLDVEVASWVVTGLAVVIVIWFVLRPLIEWWFTIYVLTTERLIRRAGVIAREGIEIPLENINDVRFSQTIFERVLGSGDLTIESAGEHGQSRFHDIPHPEHFQGKVYAAREDRSIRMSRKSDIRPDEQLETLARLHREGVITDEEFAEKRQKLLDEI